MKNDIWESVSEYEQYQRVSEMTVSDMLKEFHTSFNAHRNQKFEDSIELEELATKLIAEEFEEFVTEEESKEAILGELADLVYVCYGYADRFGWDLEEAIKRKHIANMSKLDEDGKPIFRDDGKILKSNNYKKATMEGLV